MLEPFANPHVLCAATPTPPMSTPTGIAISGAYWRLGANGKDCNTACAAYGGCIASALSGFPLTSLDMVSILSSAGLSASDCVIGQVRPLTKVYAPAHRARPLVPDCSVQGSITLPSNPTFYNGSRMASMQNCDAQFRNGSSACFYGGAWRAVQACLHGAGGALTRVLLRRRRDVLRQGCGPALPVRAR
jgi:hypothetical protein